MRQLEELAFWMTPAAVGKKLSEVLVLMDCSLLPKGSVWNNVQGEKGQPQSFLHASGP